jgi:hypothetical protein
MEASSGPFCSAIFFIRHFFGVNSSPCYSVWRWQFWFQRYANARGFGGRRNAILHSPDAWADLAIQRIAEGSEYFADILDGQ